MDFKFVNEECNLVKPKVRDSTVTTAERLFADERVPMAAIPPMWEPGESSEGGARLSTIQGGGFRSVCARRKRYFVEVAKSKCVHLNFKTYYRYSII
jgi:hypothetical protein